MQPSDRHRGNRSGTVSSLPAHLVMLNASGRALVIDWIEDAALSDGPLIAVSCLVNPNAVFIGGRLRADIVDDLVERLNQCLRKRAGEIPAIAPVLRAAMATDARAIGAAILPANEKLLPSRPALVKMS